MMKKKGVLFIIDVLLGFSIIIVGLLMVVSYYYNVPLSTQSTLYSDDFVFFLTTTRYSEFSSDISRVLINDGVVLEDESIGSSLSRFCLNNETDIIFNVINSSLGFVIPSQLNYEVNIYDLNNTRLNCSVGNNESVFNSRLSVSRSLIVSKDNDYNFIGPYVLEVRVW